MSCQSVVVKLGSMITKALKDAVILGAKDSRLNQLSLFYRPRGFSRNQGGHSLADVVRTWFVGQ